MTIAQEYLEFINFFISSSMSKKQIRRLEKSLKNYKHQVDFQVGIKRGRELERERIIKLLKIWLEKREFNFIERIGVRHIKKLLEHLP